MTSPSEPTRWERRADAIGRAARAGLAAALAPIAVAVVLAGCLPSGTRGEGATATSLDGLGSPAFAATVAPSGPPARTSFVPPTPTPEPTFLAYVVRKGDSLNTIAHRFGTTARSIAFWNRATYPSLDPESTGYRPDLLKLGWTLVLRPHDVVDEQDLPEPSASATASDPAADAPIESATP